MTEQLEAIQSQLYMSELTFTPLRERLLQSGELRAWYRYYRGGNQWVGKHFIEENVFLMSNVIIWNRISEDGKMGIHSFRLEDISFIDRNYVFEDNTKQKLILAEATITFKSMKNGRQRDTLLFKRPTEADYGDIAGFEKLVGLLD